MVKDGVEKNLDPGRMASGHKLCQVFIGAQAAVDLGVVAGVVAVRQAVKDGVQNQAGDAQLLHVVDPAIVNQLAQAVGLNTVVFVGGPAQAQGIDLIGKRRLEPAHGKVLSVRRPPEYI